MINTWLNTEPLISIIRNGELLVEFKTFICGYCGENVPENHPRAEINGGVACCDCAYLNGHISEEEYLKRACFWLGVKNKYAEIIDGKIVLGIGKKRSEIRNKRATPEYKHWRLSVFKRDKFTCQKCQKVGGTLNAHHIKSFKDHKDLRINIDNGITLCVQCHREEHGKN